MLYVGFGSDVAKPAIDVFGKKMRYGCSDGL
jgi:hypothetical protein